MSRRNYFLEFPSFGVWVIIRSLWLFLQVRRKRFYSGLYRGDLCCLYYFFIWLSFSMSFWKTRTHPAPNRASWTSIFLCFENDDFFLFLDLNFRPFRSSLDVFLIINNCLFAFGHFNFSASFWVWSTLTWFRLWLISYDGGFASFWFLCFLSFKFIFVFYFCLLFIIVLIHIRKNLLQRLYWRKSSYLFSNDFIMLSLNWLKERLYFVAILLRAFWLTIRYWLFLFFYHSIGYQGTLWFSRWRRERSEWGEFSKLRLWIFKFSWKVKFILNFHNN